MRSTIHDNICSLKHEKCHPKSYHSGIKYHTTLNTISSALILRVRNDALSKMLYYSCAYLQLAKHTDKGHFTYKPRAMTMKLWEPKESVRRPSQFTSKIMQRGHRPSSVPWSHTWPDPRPNAISINFYSCGSSLMIKKKWNKINSYEHPECHGLPVLCEAHLQEVILENSQSDRETWSIRCHVRIHVDFTSILHSHTPSVPQAECEVANLDRLRLLHQWEGFKCTWSRALSLMCEVAPINPVLLYLEVLGSSASSPVLILGGR